LVAVTSLACDLSDGIAAHHWATADINRFTYFEFPKRDLWELVAIGAASQNDEQSDQYD